MAFEEPNNFLSSDKIYTNLAWISEEFDAADNITITNQNGKDRDSEPATITTKTKDELVTNSNGYIGHSDNVNKNLSDSTQCFKGQQDDDDFDKVNSATNIIRGKYSPYVAVYSTKELDTSCLYNIY
jgi:hypothetical protein